MKIINSEVHMWANDDGDSFYAKEFENGFEITDKAPSTHFVRIGDFYTPEDFEALKEEHDLFLDQRTKRVIKSSAEEDSPERIAAMSAAETAYKAGNIEGADEALRSLDYSDAEILQFHKNWDGEDSQKKDHNGVETIESSVHLNQHRGTANLALYYTPEEIEALQPDEHGVPTRSYEEAGWDPGVPTSLQDTEDVFPEDFDENSFDLTNPSMDIFLSDLESALKKEDYAEALECLHDIGYSSGDAADLVDDFKYGVITPKDLFSAARLTAFLKSASSIRLIQNAGTVQVTADKINPVKVTSQILSFASENVDLERLNKIESCFNLDRGVSIEIPSSNPDFMKIVQCFSSTKLQPRPVLQDASFKIKSSCTRASVASLTKAFNLPDSMNQLYSRAYIKEVNF